MIRALADEYFPYRFSGGTVSISRCRGSSAAQTLVQVAKLLRLAPRYDVLLVCRKYGKYLGWIWPHQSKLVGYEFIYGRYKNSLRGYISRFVWRRAIRGFDRLFVQARSDISYYSEFFGVSGSAFSYVPICVPVSESSCIGPESDGYVFSAGRSGRDYGSLIVALKTVSVPCVIVGPKGALEPISLGGLTVHTDIPKERYLSFLQGAKIVVLPLDPRWKVSAGQVVALEAQAFGKPLIVTDVPWIRDYVSSKSTILVPPNDGNLLGQAIKDLYNAPFERLVRMGREAHEFVASNFSPFEFQKRFKNEIARVVGRE